MAQQYTHLGVEQIECPTLIIHGAVSPHAKSRESFSIGIAIESRPFGRGRGDKFNDCDFVCDVRLATLQNRCLRLVA
jgi:hypothetical protein